MAPKAKLYPHASVCMHVQQRCLLLARAQIPCARLSLTTGQYNATRRTPHTISCNKMNACSLLAPRCLHHKSLYVLVNFWRTERLQSRVRSDMTAKAHCWHRRAHNSAVLAAAGPCTSMSSSSKMSTAPGVISSERLLSPYASSVSLESAGMSTRGSTQRLQEQIVLRSRV